MLAALIRNLLGLVLGFFALPSCLELLIQVARRCDRLPPDPLAVGLGLVLGVLWMLLKRPNWFYHTFIHETCHFLACVLLLVKVERFTVSNGKGGEVQYVPPFDPVRGTLISIAPYVLPLVLTPFLVARLFVIEGPWREILSALVAFAFLTHLHGLFHNIRLNFLPRDGDLAKAGHVLALVLITGSLLLVASAVLYALWLPAPLAISTGSMP